MIVLDFTAIEWRLPTTDTVMPPKQWRPHRFQLRFRERITVWHACDWVRRTHSEARRAAEDPVIAPERLERLSTKRAWLLLAAYDSLNGWQRIKTFVEPVDDCLERLRVQIVIEGCAGV